MAAGFCAHGLAGAGGIGKVMAEWIAEGEPGLDLWEMDVRRFGAHYRSPAYTMKRDPRDLRDLLRHPLSRTTSARPGGRCGCRAPTPGTASTARPSARSPAGSGSTGTRSNAAAGDESLRPARLGGRALVAGDRRRAPRDPRGRGAVRRVLVLEAGDRRARARPSSWSACATTAWRASVGQITYTQMLNRRGGIECDFTVARLGRGAVLDRHRHGVRQPRPRVDPPPPARRGRRRRCAT